MEAEAPLREQRLGHLPYSALRASLPFQSSSMACSSHGTSCPLGGFYFWLSAHEVEMLFVPWLVCSAQ